MRAGLAQDPPVAALAEEGQGRSDVHLPVARQRLDLDYVGQGASEAGRAGFGREDERRIRLAEARIRLVEKQPRTTWSAEWPEAYGFYSNVNPDVSHPRYSQARERRIGEFLMQPTLMFNGYGDQVASLYTGMDLKRYY